MSKYKRIEQSEVAGRRKARDVKSDKAVSLKHTTLGRCAGLRRKITHAAEPVALICAPL